MAVSKDPLVPVLTSTWRGSRGDQATISLYQNVDAATGLAQLWSDDDDIEDVGDDVTGFPSFIAPLTNAKFTKMTYAGQSWTVKNYTPSGIGDMLDTGVFTFETDRVKTVSITIPAFKRELLLPTQVQGGAPTTAVGYATGMYNQDQLINMGHADVIAFAQAIITGITSNTAIPHHFSPSTRNETDGNISGCVGGRFVQKASPSRAQFKG